GPLTMVLEAARDLPAWIGDQARGTVGVRVPQHPVALELLTIAGALSVSSANRSGEAPAVGDEDARAVFGDSVVGYLAGEGGAGTASTVLDVTVEPPKILRAGPVELG
ncbi:MAG: L-threonylcarbamoyladenylate synthase, partial [Acidimicrobiia bacterium]